MFRLAATVLLVFACFLHLNSAVQPDIALQHATNRYVDEGQTKLSKRSFVKEAVAPKVRLQSVHQQEIENTTLGSIIASVNDQVFTSKQRQTLLYNAIRVIEGMNPNFFIRNRFLKVNPVSAMRTFATYAHSVSNFEFHMRMRYIFNSMNDGHTIYTPPLQLVRTAATLGFNIKFYFERPGGKLIYVFSGPNEFLEFKHPTLTKGAEIISIDNKPVDKMAARLGSLAGVANKAAQLRTGTMLLTSRRLAYHPLPEKSFAKIRYISTDGTSRNLNVPWRYFQERRPGQTESMTNISQLFSTSFKPIVAMQVDHNIDNVFVRGNRQYLADKRPPLFQQSNVSVPSFLQDHYQTGSIVTDDGTFAYLRVKDFNAALTNMAVSGLAEIISKLPKSGLVLDLRDNPGGPLFNVVYLFQLLSSKELRPMPKVIRATALTQKMTKATNLSLIAQLQEATKNAVMFGEPFTGPCGNLYSVFGNDTYVRSYEQQYTGPIVTLANAASASAADLFVGLSRDYNISYVINVDNSTAGAGATVLDYEALQLIFPAVFKDTLPNNISFRSAFFRLYRSLSRSGSLIEYQGVEPDKKYFYTKNDVLNLDIDLAKYAIKKLVKMRI